ncbi:MAG TPA: ABC transporter ATP-binding protein [Planctomycetota bacterium]|nr:ABC transporter ATP-binding protein [Planctomycetota bacterium]
MRVEIRGLDKRFGAVHALRDVALDLPSGSRTALVGPNGSGKSTLTRVLMGMLDFTGTVLLDGLDPRHDRARLAPRVAYVPQIAPRLGAPVREIVAAVVALRDLPPDAVGARCAALDLDLAAVAGRPFRDLSGGMRQKLLIALALAARPDLLVLDEPTASLDPAARARFFRLAATLPQEPTVVLCSHRLDEIRHLVERVVVLEDGRVRYDGPVAAYLRGSAFGHVEVLVDGDAPRHQLERLGFVVGAHGWWSRSVRNGERIAVLRDLTDRLGPHLRDLVVRDEENLDPGRSEPS